MSENETTESAADSEVESGAETGDAPEDGADQPSADSGAEPEADAETERDAESGEGVDELDADELAGEIEALRERATAAEARAEEAEERAEEVESRLKRTQADFQNYKKRMKKRREQEQERATEDLVSRLLDVRDNLVRALDQDEDADIRDGVEATLRQFDRVFEAENVGIIDPEPGESVDPQRHEVLMRVDSDQPEGTVDGLHRPGYEMAEKVLRPAQVTVSDGSEE